MSRTAGRAILCGALGLGFALLLRTAPAAAAPVPPTVAGQPTTPARPADAPEPLDKRLKAYPGRYYTIHTDLDADAVREAETRMTAMAEEYHRRTSAFGGVIRDKLTFCLYKRQEDYRQAGGLPGSAGMYNAHRKLLMAHAAGGVADDRLWHVVQHEGWHQFAGMVIGGDMPVWLNEGMAEYFAQAVWTGDAFVIGLAPPSRIKRIRAAIRDRKLVDFLDMLLVRSSDWTKAVSAGKAQVYYDQSWSMVHFLVHGENGKCRRSFEDFVRDIGRGGDWRASFQTRFGRNIQAFQKRYEDWWTACKDDLAEPLYIKAAVQTLAGYAGRAAAQGQQFADAGEFFRAARGGELKLGEQWLPPSLLERNLLRARGLKEWSLEKQAGGGKLVLRQPEGRTFTGSYTIAGGRLRRVTAKIEGEKEEGK
jgi:hypothetical protein